MNKQRTEAAIPTAGPSPLIFVLIRKFSSLSNCALSRDAMPPRPATDAGPWLANQSNIKVLQTNHFVESGPSLRNSTETMSLEKEHRQMLRPCTVVRLPRVGRLSSGHPPPSPLNRVPSLPNRVKIFVEVRGMNDRVIVGRCHQLEQRIAQFRPPPLLLKVE